MINAVQTTIPQPDGSDRQVIIEPILEKDGEQGLRATGVFKVYKDAFGDETHYSPSLQSSARRIMNCRTRRTRTTWGNSF